MDSETPKDTHFELPNIKGKIGEVYMLFLEGIRFGKDTEEKDTKKELEFAGLVNNGMTCYMNSLL